jgi:hypothetical protein
MIEERAGLRDAVFEVVVVQYALHEMQHHPSSPLPDPPAAARVPRAHTLADVYKCLHQGEFGIGHNIQDLATFKQRLTDELQGVPAVADEPVLESITPDDSIFRMNLRPYKTFFAEEDLDSGCELLTQICAESARIEKGSIESLFGKLRAFRELNNDAEMIVEGTVYAFPGQLLDQFLAEVFALSRALRGVPVLGHSNVYRHLNSPAYRVIDEAVLKQSPLAFLCQ